MTPAAVPATDGVAAPSRPIMRVRSVTKDFVRSGRKRASGASVVQAVRGVSLEVAESGVIGLVGESGSGKTTLARCMSGLMRPSEGEIEWLGLPLSTLSPRDLRDQWRNLQMVFQNPYATLDPRMSVAEIVREPLDNFRVGVQAAREDRVAQTLNDVGIGTGLMRRRPDALSGGQRQRVALARALVLSPRLVIMDEPVSALDVSIQAQVLTLIRDLQTNEKISFVIILHDLAVARQLCDHLHVMYRGRVVENGRTEEVLNNPTHPYTVRLLAAAPEVGTDWRAKRAAPELDDVFD